LKVGQHHVERFPLDDGERLLAARGAEQDGVCLRTEQPTNSPPLYQLVVDQQDPPTAGVRVPVRDLWQLDLACGWSGLVFQLTRL
jgi:hypothetical protein